LTSLVAVWLLLGPAAAVRAQLGIDAAYAPHQEKPDASFTLPAQSTDYKDGLEQFQRMVQHEQWEKAFAALATISEKTTTGYIDRGDGVLVPSRLLVRGLLAKLPSAGKSAYRLFYDTEAAQLWDKAVGRDESEHLSTIVSNHLISSVGDRAADRLGDLYFERGEFQRAAAAWQTILDHCPDSKISKPRTMVKIATALARDGRWSEFRRIEGLARERYAGEEIELGGRRVTVADEVARLASSSESPAPAAQAALVPDFELPRDDRPAWRFEFYDANDPQAAANPFKMVDVYGRPMANEFAMPAAADDQRVYVNVFGVEMAFDLATGKLLWRSGKLMELDFQQARQGVSPERYSLDLFGGRVWSVGREPQQASQRGPFVLTVRDAASGKEIFTSRRGLGSWSILGAPRVVDNVAYVGAQRNGEGRDLSVLMLDAASGKLRKALPVGSYAADTSQIYNDRVPRPTITWRGDRLYVDTHSGAVACVNFQAETIDWAILYDSPAPQAGYQYNYVATRNEPSSPLFAGGLLFSKGMRSARLLGIAADGPQLEWSRPVSDSAVLVAADDERVYLGGEELTAYSQKTQELLWSAPLPRSADWSLPLVADSRIYQFTSRGVCEVDKASGRILNIFRGADLDSLGGLLFAAGGKLITVSNMAITAYALDAPPPQANPQ
jgi:outer membrane protein assembly factor BamB